MLERLKGARPDQTEAEDRKRNEAKDGMPRFQPQPGGFGRRATPVSDTPAANSDSPWVLGRGWDYETLPGTLPTRQMLDALVADRPALVLSNDGRMAWVNSAALKLARITRRTPNPAGRARA